MESAHAKARGTPQLWTLLSFTGRFDARYLEDAIAKGKQGPPTMPGETTEQQKKDVRAARLARAQLRRGAMLKRLQERLKPVGRKLNASQLQVLEQYESGKLRHEANNLTLRSTHGRLKRDDDSFVDIGGSTGGFVRTVLDDWEPPDLEDFDA